MCETLNSATRRLQRPTQRQCLALWLLPLCLLLLSPLLAGSAPFGPFYVEDWKTGPGQLPQSSVIAMTRTHDGYLWLGTVNGLVRFDGSHFAVFDESVTPRLGSSAIVRLFEDREHNLWIGTDTAGTMLVKNGRIINLDIGRGTRQGRLVGICQDSVGAVWLLTESELGRYFEGEVNVWSLAQGAPGRCMAAETDGRVWVGTEGGISGIDPRQVHGRELGDQELRAAQGEFSAGEQRRRILAIGRLRRERRSDEPHPEMARKPSGKGFWRISLADFPGEHQGGL